MRIPAASVIEHVRRAQPDDVRWRPHDVCHLLGIHSARLRELERREGLTGTTWTLEEVSRLVARQLADGTPEERDRAAEALAAIQEAEVENNHRRPRPH